MNKIKNNYIRVFIFALITATIIFIPFLIYDNGLFLYYGDFDVQQIPFYELAHKAVREGNMGFSFITDLGSNFIGSYSFYLLGSPFFWLTIPFPTSVVPYLMAPLLILKFSLSAVTSYAFISRFTKSKDTAIIGCLIYAFCGFNIYNIFFNHFNEVVVLFPLMLVALEELINNDRYGVFALTVCASALMNYYFFFGQVIFIIIYFIIRCFDKNFNVTIKKFFILALEAIIGLLMSSILLLPSIMTIISNTRLSDNLWGFDMICYNNVQRYGLILESMFFPPDIPARPNFFPDSNSKWSSVSLFLPLFSMAGVFAFFKGVKKHWAKTLLSICVLLAFIPILNASFSAFNYSYYARWFYMPLLIMAMVTCIALENHEEHFPFGIKLNLAIVGAFSLIGVLPKKEDGKLIFFSLPPHPERFWAYVIIALIGIVLTYTLYTLSTKHKRFITIAVSMLIPFICVYSMFVIFTGKTEGNGYDVVAKQAIKWRPPQYAELEEQFFRIDSYDELDNLGMHWQMPTINAFHSVVPSSVTEYYVEIGEKRGVASRPKPEYIGIRALNSVKYQYKKANKTENQLLGFEYIDTQNGYDIFENKHFIPMGFTYDYLLANHQFEQTTKKDRILLKGLLLEDEAYEKYNYLLPTIDDISVKSLSDQAFLQDCDILAKNASSDFRYDKDAFACTITSDKPNLAFFSIPYEEGFSATVNGKEVEILKANIGFMAVEIPAGTSTIQFNYKTPGLKAGALISIISAIILILYVIIIKKLSKNWVYKSTDEDIISETDFVLSENTTDDTEEIQAENPPENDNLS